jgi:hypothetical protein|tara:strand:- start:124 stop:792 length:669 start_codon:yes stop_codon:yes gene_type:complete
MPRVAIEPTDEYSAPYDLGDETADTLLGEMAVAGNTAELKQDLGAKLDMSEKDISQEKELIEAVVKSKKSTNLTQQGTALAAATFLRTYASHLALDAAQARSAITNKLMEIADCGDPRFELKALELLGKHSDIGMFTERSEVTIKYRNPEELETEIRSRIKRLLNAEVVETIPLGTDLNEELGHLGADEVGTESVVDVVEVESTLFSDLDEELGEGDDRPVE